MADAHKNFAYSTVLTAPSPALSGTSLVVQTGDGTKYPAVPFNATVWPANTQPLVTNAEIVRVTAISTDTMTIVRSQESSNARTIVAGDQIAAGITAKTLTDIETALGGLSANDYDDNTGVLKTDYWGWQKLLMTLTYASATTFTVTGDYHLLFVVGTKLWLTQTTSKYFYVVSSSFAGGVTTVTITGGTDYSLANAGITAPYVSRSDVAQGFPQWFNWSPTLVGFSVNPTGVYRFCMVGKTVMLSVTQLTNGTSNSSTFTFSLPLTAYTQTGVQWTNSCQIVDNGSSSVGQCWILSGATVATIGSNGFGGLTASGNKRTLGMSISYEAA